MNNPKFREKVLIGLENAPPSFNVRGKVVGPNGANLQYITNETGAIVTIRGRGSGYIEPNTGQESLEPLHICIEHSKYDVLQAGRQLAFNLIDTVQQEWANLQHQMQQEQQQQQPPQQPPSVVSSSSNGSSQTIVANDGPQVVTSVAPPSSVALPAGFTQQAVGQMITVPPPSHVTLPPPTLHIPSQMAPPQVATSTNNGALLAQANDANQTLVPAGPSAGQEVAVSQASAQPPSINIPAQQQLFLSNQGTIIQPQTIIPQQQQIITPTGQVISAQPQVLAQSYLLQYMQTNSGQMVVSYPNMVRPANATADASRGQQFMLVQYGDGGAIKTSAVRAPAPQPQATVPQMVQIINPQTGQIQHVLQHIQPQVQMQQLQAHLQPQLVGQGGGLLGQQVLMPIQAPIQFTSQPQQMIITQPPPQLQQHQILPSGQTLQHVIPTSTLNQVTTTPVSINVSQKQIVLNIAKQQQQGLKRRFEVDQPQHLSIMDAQASHQLHAKKGIGNVWLVSAADGTPGLAQTVCSPTYRYPAGVNLGLPAVSEALLIQSGDLSLHNTQITKAEGMQRPSPAPQQEILVQSAEKNQYGQDDWRRNSPLLTENPDVRECSCARQKHHVTKSVFLDIQIGGVDVGKVVISLFGEIVPKTVENFFVIATRGIKGVTYRNSTFHRVVKGSFVEGGDILNGDGTGSISIYGTTFRDENFFLKHTGPGIVSMVNKGPDTNNCQFFITLKKAPQFDGVHVVFGQVAEGFHVIEKMNQVGDDVANLPLQKIVIKDCGIHTDIGYNPRGRVNRRSLSPRTSLPRDPNGLDPIKRSRMTQNGQGPEIGPDTRNEAGVERFPVPVKVEGGQHNQPPPQMYNVAAVPQQQQGIGVQRQQQPMQQMYQTGNIPQQPGPSQQPQVPGAPAPGQLPPGSYAQQMYPPPPLPSSAGQVGAPQQQYVAPPIYNTMPPQQPYTAAPYNPWIMPS